MDRAVNGVRRAHADEMASLNAWVINFCAQICTCRALARNRAFLPASSGQDSDDEGRADIACLEHLGIRHGHGARETIHKFGAKLNSNASRPKGNPSPIDFRAASLRLHSRKKACPRPRLLASSTAVAAAAEKYRWASSAASRVVVRSSRSTPIPWVDDHAPRKPNRQDEKLNQTWGASGR